MFSSSSADPLSSVGFDPPPARLRTSSSSCRRTFPSESPTLKGLLKNPPRGKCLRRIRRPDTSYLPRRSANKSSLLTRFDIHHSRQTLIHQSRLTRDETPPSSRVGALARRIEGEPGRIRSASKGSALRYKRSFLGVVEKPGFGSGRYGRSRGGRHEARAA